MVSSVPGRATRPLPERQPEPWRREGPLGVLLAQQVLVLQEKHRVLAGQRRPQEAHGVNRP